MNLTALRTRYGQKVTFIAPVLARLAVGLVFATSGWGKLHNLEQVTAFFTELGLPMPGPTATFTAVVELVCGAMLLVGLASRFAAIPLIVTMVVAIVTAKRAEIEDLADLAGTVEFAYIALLAWIATAGPGLVSIDHLIARRFSPQLPMAASPRAA